MHCVLLPLNPKSVVVLVLGGSQYKEMQLKQYRKQRCCNVTEQKRRVQKKDPMLVVRNLDALLSCISLLSIKISEVSIN